jgi:hypothetical protein
MLQSTSINDKPRQTASDVGEMCEQRAAAGFQSGMGKIFIDVATINPITAR